MSHELRSGRHVYAARSGARLGRQLRLRELDSHLFVSFRHQCCFLFNPLSDDPIVPLLTKVVFDRPQPPIARIRVKGGADMKQAIGTALSWLASEQVPVTLPDLDELHSMQEQLSREEVVEQSVQIAQAICQAFEAAMIQTPRIAKKHSAERISRTWLAYIVNRLRASGVVIQPKTRA